MTKRTDDAGSRVAHSVSPKRCAILSKRNHHDTTKNISLISAVKRLGQAVNYLSGTQRWLLHVGFWLVVSLWYLVFFGRQNNDFFQTLFFVALVIPVTICTTYFNNYFLIPRFLLKERTGLFCLYFLYTLIIAVFFEMIVSILTFYLMADLRTRNMSQASFDTFFLLTSLLAVVFLGMTIKLLLHWKKTQDNYQNLMLEKVEKELKFLKSQLNPHFLFNTLNNLYYLTTQKSDSAPAAILQLSEILDYSLYSSRSPFVALTKEWQQVQNYIALESLHYEDRLSVETKLTGDDGSYQIAPMILITLVENAFKHGVARSTDKAWVKIIISCEDEVITSHISNSIASNVTSGAGIGMENLRNQLAILYPEKHTLDVMKNPDEFSLTLKLKSQL